MDLNSVLSGVKSKEIEPVYKKLGENVRSMREQKGMSVQEVAERYGKSVSTVTELERGNVRVLVSDVEKIATILGVAPKVLMAGAWF